MPHPALLLSLAFATVTAEPVAFEFSPAPGVQFGYSERITGTGELTRQAREGDDPETIEFDIEALNERRWAVSEATADGVVALARSARTRARLSFGELVYLDDRPWRGFELEISGDGRVLAADVLADEEPYPPADGFDELPLDLDLGEVLILCETGLLPTAPVEVGEVWQTAIADGHQAAWRGRLVSLDEAQREAVFENRLRIPIPDRPAAMPGLRVRGELTGSLKLRFDRQLGRTLTASGPLELELIFRNVDRDRETATMRLRLNLELTADEGDG